MISQDLKLNSGKLYRVKMSIPPYGFARYNVVDDRLHRSALSINLVILFTGIVNKTKRVNGYHSYDVETLVFLIGKDMIEINSGWLTTAYLEEIK